MSALNAAIAPSTKRVQRVAFGFDKDSFYARRSEPALPPRPHGPHGCGLDAKCGGDRVPMDRWDVEIRNRLRGG